MHDQNALPGRYLLQGAEDSYNAGCSPGASHATGVGPQALGIFASPFSHFPHFF